MSKEIKKFTMSALFVSLASALSMIKLIDMPFGGCVTLFSMLMISFPSHLLGVKYGIISSFVFSLLQLFIIDPFYVHPIQVILDYIIAFTCFGIVGLFGQTSKSFVIGFIVACIIRFFSNSLSGYIFFKEYAPEGWDPLYYTIVYNGIYIFTECILSLIVLYILSESGVIKDLKNMIKNM